MREYLRLYLPRIRTLSALLGCCDASLCGKPEGSNCSLEELPSAFDQENWYTTFSGPMYAGKYFAEWIEVRVRVRVRVRVSPNPNPNPT